MAAAYIQRLKQDVLLHAGKSTACACSIWDLLFQPHQYGLIRNYVHQFDRYITCPFIFDLCLLDETNLKLVHMKI